ncbi:BatD family protein [Adhaeretor mobilis]|nr:BatD family protein [Adhaeretor mobilis]
MKLYRILAITPILLTALATGATAAGVRASLSSLEAYVGNPVVMRLEVANAGQHDAPQIQAIDGIDVISAGTPRRSTQTTIINGRRSENSSITHAWKLIPRREGVFTIPPISVEVDGQKQTTMPLRFSATKSETGDLLFAEIVGSQDHIYVGQPMKLKLRIWVKPYMDRDLDITLSEGDMWQMLSQAKSSWGMFEDRINELASNSQRPGGEEVLRADDSGVERRYFLYEIEADTYPKRPGKIDGDSVQIVVDYPTRLGKTRDPFGSFFDNGFTSMFQDRIPSSFGSRLSVTDVRPIVASAKVNATEVLAIPAEGRPADYRGAVGHYQIISQATPDGVKAGDPITLHLGIQGDGPMDLVQAPPLSQLPELSADFKVADQPLAGIVRDDVKLFTTSIRPRREGITHIPAIPFSFFDPATKEFVTVHSKPVAIEVAAPDRLALDAIVGRSANTHSSSASDTTVAPNLNLTNFTGGQVLSQQTPSSNWPIALAWLLPPLVFLMTLTTRNLRRIGSILGISRGGEFKTAELQIEKATSPSGIAQALTSFVSGRLGMDGSLPNLNRIIEQADQTVRAETLAKFQSIVQSCEQLSYAGLDLNNVSALRNEAAICLQDLAAELPAPNHHSGHRFAAPRLTGKAAKAAAITVLATMVLCGTSRASAAELSPHQSSLLLAEAEAAYSRAQTTAASDSAESKEAFAQAAQKYQTLVDDGVVNDRIYFNLGNAYLQSGSTGLAIAYYEHALAMNPGSPARQNLAVARESLPNNPIQSAGSPSFFQALLSWNEQVPRSVMMGLGLMGWAVFWLGLRAQFLHRGLRVRPFKVPAVILTSVCVASLCLPMFGPQPHDRVVVVTAEVHLREGNGEAFTQLDTVVHEGIGYELLEQRGDWMKVQTEGTSGWIHGRDAMHVAVRPVVET